MSSNNVAPVVTADVDVEFSFTIEKKGSHVIPVWLDSVGAYMASSTVAGCASLERGAKMEHLHIQGVRVIAPRSAVTRAPGNPAELQ